MTYFTQRGTGNTEETAKLALQAAKERNIEHIVVASNTGETAEHFLNSEKQIVCVTHVDGYRERGTNEMSAESRARLERAGVSVLTTAHILSGVERGLSRRHKGIYPAEIVSETLRMFGQGTKVCIEVAIMAADAGLIPYGERVVAVGGTSRGADTALVLTPAYAAEIFDTRIHETICKPLLFDK